MKGSHRFKIKKKKRISQRKKKEIHREGELPQISRICTDYGFCFAL